jgi:hypothetical protein
MLRKDDLQGGVVAEVRGGSGVLLLVIVWGGAYLEGGSLVPHC